MKSLYYHELEVSNTLLNNMKLFFRRAERDFPFNVIRPSGLAAFGKLASAHLELTG